jgi:Zn finger protein HypA/HybF involved in hydrogenase expression
MFEFIKKIFSNKISDEEFDKLVEESEAVPCPNCGIYVSREIWEEEHQCPKCKQKVDNISKEN